MTETWVRDQLAELLTAPAPQPPSHSGLIVQGHRIRRRRQARIGAVIVAAALVAVGVPVAVANTDGGSQTGRLVPGSAASATANPDETGEASPYWFEQDEQLFYKTSSKGVVQLDSDLRSDQWLGNDRPGVSGRGTGPGYSDLTVEPAFGKPGGPAPSTQGWDKQWRTPTDAASVRAYLQADVIFPANYSEDKVYRDEDLFSAGAGALEYPGPARFRTAVIGVMKSLQEVKTTTGRDAVGRPATVLTFDEGPTGATSMAYVDVPSATLLETAEQLDPGGTASHVVSTTTPRLEDIWRDTGPVATVPAGATTTAQQEAASKAHPQGLTTPHRQGAAGHACTPGVPVDVNKVRDRLASMCLDTTVPRFAARRSDDSAAVDGASFYLSDGPLPRPVKQPGGGFSQGANGASVTLQILPGLRSFILSGGSHSLTPNAAGKVGTTTYVAQTTVLGVPADEISEDGQIGILANIDGMSLECYADAGGAAPVTYSQLVAVIDHLRWDRLGK